MHYALVKSMPNTVDNMKKFLFVFSIGLMVSLSGYSQSNDPMLKLTATMQLIQNQYVDTVNLDKLVEKTIRKTLETLDPHSTYIPKRNLERVNEPLVGNFEGVGIQFNILRDTIMVVQTISGGPSEKVGIMAGDKIIYIGDSLVAGNGITNNDVIKSLRGKKGTVVEVMIKRGGTDELLDFEITRDKIPLFSVDASYMVDDETGYIKINRFAAKTTQEFVEACNKLREEGMQNLILDLQGNGGGYLNTAVTLADQFVADQHLIVYTEGENSPKKELNSSANGVFQEGKLIVLIDETSASASEIVSGAVQDWDRGLIIGRRSFGKGLVQQPYNLPDGSVIRLTIARYYTPSGRSIQKPYNEGKKEYYKEISDRLNSGELMSMDSISFPDSLMHYTEGGRPVFGGGGIMPDFFVPIDTSGISDYYASLIRKGVLFQFALSYLDSHRDEMEEKYTDLSAFKDGFEITEEFEQQLIEYGEGKKVEFDQAGFDESKELLHIQMRALLARNLWGSSAYFEVFNEINPTFLQAVKVLEDKKAFKKQGIAVN